MPPQRSIVGPSIIAVRAERRGQGGNCPLPPQKKIFFEYFVIRATDPQRFGQKEFSKRDKISCLFPNQT